MAVEPPPPPPPDDLAPKRETAKATPQKRPTRPTRTKAEKELGTEGTEGTEGSASPRAEMRGRKGKPRAGTLQDRLEELFSTPALLYSFAGDQYAASIIADRTPAMAEAWAELAKQNAGIKRILERLTEGSAWGAVILSTASVLLPLLQHHGVVPGGDPFTLMYGAPTAPQGGGPLVPPPSTNGTVPPPPPGDNGFTPPVANVPGAVTVADLVARGAFTPAPEQP